MRSTNSGRQAKGKTNPGGTRKVRKRCGAACAMAEGSPNRAPGGTGVRVIHTPVDIRFMGSRQGRVIAFEPARRIDPDATANPISRRPCRDEAWREA